MRKSLSRGALAIAGALVLAVCMTGSAQATIDWAGNVWPLHDTSHLPSGPIDVYAQVYKGGVTDGAGQGPDISAVLYYTPEGGSQQSVGMTYQGDVGNNDEYTAQVPQAVLVGIGYVDVTVVFTDETDGSTFEVAGDQNGNPPPIRYNVTNALPNDVDVTFTLCMSGNPTTGVPCVIGSAPEIGSWGTGVNMAPEGSHPDLWIVTVTFAAGGNPDFAYKYKRDDCNDWESVGDRLVTLPTDGTTNVVLPIDSWNNSPLGCGIGETLNEDKTVCFRVCMNLVPNVGDVCVTGSTDELTMWSNGVLMTEISPELFEVCVTFPAGTPVQDVEYKFRKDGCETWENVPNRIVTLDNNSPSTQTVYHNFDDTPGDCGPISTDERSWGAVKGLYR